MNDFEFRRYHMDLFNQFQTARKKTGWENKTS
jgi:hypothetical protein